MRPMFVQLCGNNAALRKSSLRLCLLKWKIECDESGTESLIFASFFQNFTYVVRVDILGISKYSTCKQFQIID